MLLGAIDGRFTGFLGDTVLDHGNESMAGKRISELSMKFPWESQEGSATGANPVPELLSPGLRCSLCQAPELCVSGPGAASWSAYKVCSIAGICLRTIESSDYDVIYCY